MKMKEWPWQQAVRWTLMNACGEKSIKNVESEEYRNTPRTNNKYVYFCSDDAHYAGAKKY